MVETIGKALVGPLLVDGNLSDTFRIRLHNDAWDLSRSEVTRLQGELAAFMHDTVPIDATPTRRYTAEEWREMQGGDKPCG